MNKKVIHDTYYTFDAFPIGHLFGPHYSVDLCKLLIISRSEKIIAEVLEELVPVLKSSKISYQ